MVAGRRLGVELICSVLQVVPSSYYEFKNRQPSARAQRDEVMGPVVRSLWEDNYRVYGAREVWKSAQRTGHDIGRDQVSRLMLAAGIEGVRRTKRVRTTKPDLGMPRHSDLVSRNFTATGPNQLWVTDLTFVPTWAGVAYVCSIIDACSRAIVGWRLTALRHRNARPMLLRLESRRADSPVGSTGVRLGA